MKLPIGSVGFAYKGSYIALTGEERVRALRLFYLKMPVDLPVVGAGHVSLSPIAVVSGGGWAMRQAVSWDDVNWDTAGPRVTKGLG